MKFFNHKMPIVFFLLATFFISCDDDEPNVNPVVLDKYENGFFIANEGPFKEGTGTVSFFNYETNSTENNVFQSANSGIPLGNILQSIAVHEKEVFMVVNNARKIEVADVASFERTNTITGLAQPRYFQGITTDKAYVSQWGNGSSGNIAVVDLNTFTVTDSIVTGIGPERMLLNDDELYVTCSGGFTTDSTVAVINTVTDEVITNIKVGAEPSGIVEDKEGNIWVLCTGKFNADFSALDISGSLVKIDPNSNSVVLDLNFDNLSFKPSNLIIDEDRENLFYVFNGGVYRMPINSTALVDMPLFSVSSSFYGLGYDPESDYLIGSDAGDFVSSGNIIRYNPETGVTIDDFSVGVIPNGGFYFPDR
ncbi:MAG: DUF5074 domain-containing protein [Bacteroidota bacterium]